MSKRIHQYDGIRGQVSEYPQETGSPRGVSPSRSLNMSLSSSTQASSEDLESLPPPGRPAMG